MRIFCRADKHDAACRLVSVLTKVVRQNRKRPVQALAMREGMVRVDANGTSLPGRMVSRLLDKVKASLNTLCPKCGHSIPPEKLYRVDSDHIQCPECAERFIPRVKEVRQ